MEQDIASPAQKRMFFALCKEKGIDSERAEKRAEERFGLGSFKDLTKKQASELIDLLQPSKVKPVDEKPYQHQHHWAEPTVGKWHLFYECVDCSGIQIEPI